MSHIRARARIAVLAVLIAFTALIGGSSSASAAPTNNIHTCGIVTCSDYYSHTFTVAFNEWLEGKSVEPDERLVAACEVGGETVEFFKLVEGGALIAVPCAVFHVLSWARSVIRHAAETNGCMRFRHPKGSDRVSFAVYADHSSTCHRMDQ